MKPCVLCLRASPMLVAVSMVGCGGSGDAADDAGGTSDTSGTGGATASGGSTGTGGTDSGGTSGGSGDASSTARAGLTFTVVPVASAPAGTQCITSGDAASVGDPPAQVMPPTAGGLIADGEDDQGVTCTVAGSGPYTVVGEVTGRNTSPTAQFPDSLVSFSIEEGSVPPQDVGSAQVAIFTASLAVALQAPRDMPCSVQAFDASAEGNGLYVREGAMFARIDCPALVDVRTPSTYCAGRGVVALEHCEIQ